MIGIESGPSKTQQLIDQMGWSHKPSGTDQCVVDICPYCQNSNGKFFINVGGGEKDGLHDCKVCGATGNYFKLRQKLGVEVQSVMSMHDVAASKTAPQPLPNFDLLHKRLFDDDKYTTVLEYLVDERGFSIDTIKALKLGAEEFNGTLWYVIPYFDAKGNPVFYKSRTVPPAKKDFRGPAGRIAPLYNDAVLKPGMDELVLCEGEADAIALINQGYEHVVGIPGAANKKAEWLEKLDAVAPKKIYLCYDSDKVGQNSARDMAIRIGIEKVFNITIPEFEKEPGKPGKDLNEWFVAGATLESFDTIKAAARPFDVMGIQSLASVLEDLKSDIEEKGVEPTFTTQYPELNSKLGGFEPGDLVGIMAEGKVGKTTFALNLLDHQSKLGHNGLMYCLEMPPKRMVRKWVSMVTRTDDSPGKSQITPAVVDAAVSIGAERPGDLLFGFTRGNKADDVFETIKQAVRRYGLKFVCFDNLQLLVRDIRYATQETSTLTKRFKELAMELGIVIFLIIQPHRVPDGQIVAARNAAGSSGIEKDVDCMICLHRNRVAKIKETEFNGHLDTDDNFEPHLLTRVDLSRYAAGGCCTLFMEGEYSTVRSFTKDDIALVPGLQSGLIPVTQVTEV